MDITGYGLLDCLHPLKYRKINAKLQNEKGKLKKYFVNMDVPMKEYLLKCNQLDIYFKVQRLILVNRQECSLMQKIDSKFSKNVEWYEK